MIVTGGLDDLLHGTELGNGRRDGTEGHLKPSQMGQAAGERAARRPATRWTVMWGGQPRPGRKGERSRRGDRGGWFKMGGESDVAALQPC